MKNPIPSFNKQNFFSFFVCVQKPNIFVITKNELTNGDEERELVLGSKEKISIAEEEEDEELAPVIDRPNTTQLTFSGRRIHDPHVTDPPAPPSIDEEKGKLRNKSTTEK